MPKLKDNIFSTVASVCYGLIGDPVTIVADRGEMLIVESIVGNRFPVRRDQVAADDVKVDVKDPGQTVTAEKKAATTKKSKQSSVKKADDNQLKLL